MSRYIDAEPMCCGGKREFPYNIDFCDEGDIDEWIKEQPTVDAEPVIRCKDCNHYQRDGYLEGFGWCYFHRHAFSDNDFCSSAKRRKENNG